MKIPALILAAMLAVAGCSKTPESKTAVDIGKQPKQLVDKVTSDVGKAMQKEEQRQQDAEKKE